MGFLDVSGPVEAESVVDALRDSLGSSTCGVRFSFLQASICSKQEVRFNSGKEVLAAWLYMPPIATQAVPCVVMANGISLTRNDGILGYAEAFAKLGLAVLVFDYTSFGDSTGFPRRNPKVKIQRRDYRAAISYVRNFPAIHPGGVILWGYSFGCGHVLKIAREDPKIAAVICIAPFLGNAKPVSTKNKISIAKGVMKDSIARVIRPEKARANPVMFPVVGPPGSRALITTEEGVEGFEQVTPEDSRWINDITVKGLFGVPFSRPKSAATHLKMPVLFCIGSYDQTALPSTAIKTGERLPRGEVKIYSAGHFDIHFDPKVKSDQVDFLDHHMRHYLSVV